MAMKDFILGHDDIHPYFLCQSNVGPPGAKIPQTYCSPQFPCIIRCLCFIYVSLLGKLAKSGEICFKNRPPGSN